MDELQKRDVEKPPSEKCPKKGGVYAAMRTWPLVGVELDLRRLRGKVREVSLATSGPKLNNFEIFMGE